MKIRNLGAKMKDLGRKEKTALIILSFTYLAMLFIIAQGLWKRGLDNMEPIYVLDVGIDIVGVLMGYVLFICCTIDIQKNGANLKYFIYMLNVTMWSLFTDAGSWLLDGISELRWLNILDNTMLFMCAPLSAYCFWNYVNGIITVERSYKKIIDMVAKVGLILAVLMRFLNLFTGIYFSVDKTGVYSRSSAYLLSMLYPVSMLIIVAVVVIVERKQLQAYQTVSLMLYVLAPVIAVVIATAVYGLSISAIVIMMTLLLMYCILNVSQGRAKAAADHELGVAAAIQENVLPRIFPFMPERKEFDVYATMTPAKEVGGDFYDFFMIDDDHLAIVIADVSGKGMPAALFMMVARTMIKNRTLAVKDADPGEILADVNNQLCEGNTMEYFVTAWMGIISLSTGVIKYASAGHEYPAVYKAGGKYEIIKGRNAPPLAAMEDLFFKTGEAALEPGDIVYIYTDGVAEATDTKGELFGTQRMIDVLNANIGKDLPEIDAAVRKGIDDFVGEAPQFDDITMLTLKYNGNVS